MAFPRPARFAVLLLGVLCLVALWPLIAEDEAPRIDLSASERAWLATHPVVRVIADPDWAPFEYRDASGRYRGVTVDYLDRIAELLGVRFEYPESGHWAELNAQLEAGEFDMSSAMIPTPSRERWLEFLDPYLMNRYTIFGHAGMTFVEDVEDLRGARVAAVAGFGLLEYLRADYPDLNLIRFSDTETAIATLASGKADFFLTDLASAGWYIQKLGITNIRALGDTPYEFPLSMAVRRDREPLASIMAKALRALGERESQAIRRVWFSSAAPRPYDPRPILFMALAGFALMIGVASWNRVLSMRVKVRTAELAAANESLQAEVRERQSAEARLSNALKARGVLLAELNHRVKNNLQMALSLVRMSSLSAKPGERGALDAAAGRLEAITRVHETLNAESPDLSVELADYIEHLAADERALLGEHISLVVDAEGVRGLRLDLKRSVNLGLVINELVTNARKYAFPDGRRGCIRIFAARHEAGGIVISIGDDGVGMDPAGEARGDSLGMGIVHSISEGLGATLELATTPGEGTRWRLELPAPEAAS